MRRGKQIQVIVCLSFCTTVLLAIGPQVSAQAPASLEAKKYRSMFDEDLLTRGLVDKNLVGDRRLRNTTKFLVTGICSGSKPMKTVDVDNTKTFDNYFKRYFFPLMTDPDEVNNIADMRQDLMKTYFGRIKNDAAGQQIRDHLNEMTLSYMRGLAGTRLGEFHPAVRYNAMLIIGDLDSKGPESIGNPQPAEPLLSALEVMRAELVSKDQIDAVRVAALIGISRHAELDRHRPEAKRIPAVSLRKLIEDLLELAAAKKPPAGRTVDGHNWMRRQAVEALALLAATRPIGPVAKLLDEIVSDPNEPLALRCAVAESQGRMLAPLAEGVTAEQAAMKLVRLGDEVLDAELNDLQPYLDELKQQEAATGGSISSGGGRFDGGGIDIFGSSSSSEEGTEVTLERAPQVAATQRRGKQRLICIGGGLFGTDGGPGVADGIKDAATKSKINKVQELIDATQTVLVDEAPLGEKPTLDEVKPYFVSIETQRKQFAEIAPAPRKEAAPELGPGPDSTPAADGLPTTSGSPDGLPSLP